MVEGEYVAGSVLAYFQPTIGGNNRAHNNIKHNRDSEKDMDNKQLHTERRCRVIGGGNFMEDRD